MKNVSPNYWMQNGPFCFSRLHMDFSKKKWGEKKKKKKKHKPSLFYPHAAGSSCLSFLHLPGSALQGDWAKTLCHMSTCNGHHEIQTSRRFSGVPGVKPGVDCFWEIISEHPKMQKRKRQIKSSKNVLRNENGSIRWWLSLIGGRIPRNFQKPLPKRSTIYSVSIL